MGALGNPLYGQNKFDASADGKIGVIQHVKPASDGTVSSPTKTLTASDSGNIYIVIFLFIMWLLFKGFFVWWFGE